jgi:hypothetical protein
MPDAQRIACLAHSIVRPDGIRHKETGFPGRRRHQGGIQQSSGDLLHTIRISWLSRVQK